jgi:hypothetical protein
MDGPLYSVHTNTSLVGESGQSFHLRLHDKHKLNGIITFLHREAMTDAWVLCVTITLGMPVRAILTMNDIVA